MLLPFQQISDQLKSVDDAKKLSLESLLETAESLDNISQQLSKAINTDVEIANKQEESNNNGELSPEEFANKRLQKLEKLTVDLVMGLIETNRVVNLLKTGLREMVGHDSSSQDISIYGNKLESDRRGLEALRNRGLISRFIRANNSHLVADTPLLEFDASRKLTYEQALKGFESASPEVFKVWQELFEVNKATYEGHPTHSCSVNGHEAASYFRDFLEPYLHGNVLDIGCGPQPMPHYLDSYDPKKTYGVDPIAEENGQHLFNFYNGFAEFLPWADSSFDVAVCGTSLDHVFLLDKSLDEITRVLKPAGWFLTWVYFIEGAEMYNPYDSQSKAIDDYHLFHFDRGWFEDMMRERFSFGEVIELTPDTGYRGTFYAFQVAK